MKEIFLASGEAALVDDEDYPLLSRFKWCWGGSNKSYPMTVIYGKCAKMTTVYMHQLIMGGITNTDHIDRNKLNNQKSNLRDATVSENGWNTEKPNGVKRTFSSKYKGVMRRFTHTYGYHWTVLIRTSKKGEKPAKHIRLGPFNNETEAAKAYNQKIVELRGEFAWINPIPEVA